MIVGNSFILNNIIFIHKIYFKELISAHEFLNGKKRWCLWLEDIAPKELRNLKLVKERVENVQKIREK